MYIHRSRKFQSKLLTVLIHIAKDKVGASEKFHIDLEEQIDNITNFPFKYKSSIYFDDKNVRDMTFKKYTIIYEINLDKNRIEFMDIFNRNKPSR
jgi:plasmid stabilization system protein ParE